MNYKLADRVNKIQPSFTLQMATIAAEMRARGEDVINFSVGEPDFNTPRHIINAGKEAMDQGYTKYTAGPGMIEFREAICDKLKRENGIDFTKQNILSRALMATPFVRKHVTLKVRKISGPSIKSQIAPKAQPPRFSANA